MDPLALLTRSAKTPKSRPRAAPAQMPSRGPSGNPQLYQSSTGNISASGLKRKRDSDAEAQAHGQDNALDFFSQSNGASKGRSGSAHIPASGSLVDVDEAEEEPIPERMSLSERRKLFKEHKLKFSILEQRVEPVKSSKKKTKKTTSNTTGAKSAEQIFPDPVTQFRQLRSKHKLSSGLVENIQEQGFRLPTEVQLAALPVLLNGESELYSEDDEVAKSFYGKGDAVNLLTIAPTGSGKTIAFLIPLIDAIHRAKSRGETDGPQAVVLAPTKELVNQIVNEGRKLASGLGLDIQSVRKGINLGLSGTEAIGKSIPDIIVGTPIGLQHILEKPAEGETEGMVQCLPTVTRLVLDEADVLLDPLFKKQTVSVWEALNNASLTVSLWSATVSSSVETDIKDIIAKRHEALRTPAPLLLRLVVGLKDSAVPNISHRLTYCATEPGKLMALRELMMPKSVNSSSSSEKPLRAPFLVFTQTIPRASALHSELKFDIPASAGGSSRIAVLHSELPDRVRDKILTNFRKGEIWVLITTDLLARGVDFKGVNGVVNYDIPTSAASYVHRVGRTGRAGREGGVAVTLYTKEDIKWVKIIANIAASTEQRGGKTEGVQQWLLDALPDVSKQDRKRLKTRGVQERRKDEKTSRISSKSGFVRREENKRRDKAQAARRAD
ncbi:hypothetical protein ANO11243_087870 [Dothideomycetidae sp. 11243]|nr:hypothetical protein ANO11243_087870 [fungal sp. No.11243]